MSQARKHILLLCFPAYGHAIPLLELAKKISAHHRVTFALSSFMVAELQKRGLSFDQDAQNALELVSIDDGNCAEFEDPNSADQLAIFEKVFKTINQPTVEFVEAFLDRAVPPPDAVIGDGFFGSQLAVCHQRGIPFYMFNSANAGFGLAILTMTEDHPVLLEQDRDKMDPFIRPPKPGARKSPLPLFFKNLLLKNKTLLPEARGMIVNSFREIEQDNVNVLKQFPSMKTVIISCIGPLFPEQKEEKAEKRDLAEKVQTWLDGKSRPSVVYVSFGTIAIPTPEQIGELGAGLLLLNQPFILSLREPLHAHLPTEIQDQISKQFETSDGKFLVLPWCPQKLIMNHPATRVFVSHCGWNSTLEAMFGGVPVVGWPMFADQLMNAEWITKHGLGQLIDGTGVKPKRVILASEIKETISGVAGWGAEGEIISSYTTSARAWKDKIEAAVAPNGSSQKEFDELIQFSDEKQ